MKRGESVWKALRSLVARNRRRYGGYAIHFGVVIMTFGVIGIEFFQQETQLRMQTGDSVTLGKYTMVFNGATRYEGADDLLITEAALDVFIGDRLVKQIAPRTELYQRTGQPMTIPDVRYTPLEDFYVLMVNWEGVSADAATFKAYLNPLVNWVWTGGAIFVIGTMIAAWPDTQPVRATAPRRRSTPYSFSTD